MIIRTITVFDSFDTQNYKQKLTNATILLNSVKNTLHASNYEVQSLRVSSNLINNCDSYSLDDINQILNDISIICDKSNIDFFNLGCIKIYKESNNRLIDAIPKLLSNHKNIFCSFEIAPNEEENDYEKSFKAALLFKNLVDTNCETTFRTSFHANTKEFIPFYPVSYTNSENPSFAIGSQSSTFINSLINDDKNINLDTIKRRLEEEYKNIEILMYSIESNYEYLGIDTSIAPMTEDMDSINTIYKHFTNSNIGEYGSLAFTAKLTKMIKNINVKKIGYCGVMLPILEDKMLAENFSNNTLDIQKILFYSSVCACGLDTIPISSNFTSDEIAKIYYDLSSLAFRLNKPLSARLMSMPNSMPGELTCFNSKFLCNTKLIV